MDKLTKEQRRKNMQAVKSKGSKIETKFAKALYHKGYRYRRNDKSVFGCPDISFKKYKLAIFIDGEFWHGYNWATAKNDHKTNIDFWHKKIEQNIKRDKTVNAELKKQGWTVLRFWGKEVDNNLNKCIEKVENEIKLKMIDFKEKILIEEYFGKKFRIRIVEPNDNREAILTHYIHSKSDKNAKYFKKEAFRIAKEILKYKYPDEEISNSVAEQAFQYNLFANFDVPFLPNKNPKFTFIDLFAGIGGFRIALQNLGGKCVFSSEWDEKAKKTYKANFGETPFGDITLESTKSFIPDNFDVLCAGFPCQAFSIAGKRGGFEDTRGTLFFDVAEIIKRKQPKAIFLENVKGLTSHDRGRTLATILNVLREDLGYFIPEPEIINAKDFGVPQNRERIFIVGFHPKTGVNEFTYPEPLNKKVTFANVKEEKVPATKYYLSTQYLKTLEKHKARHERKGHGFGYEIIPDDSISNAIVVGGMGRERNLVYDHRITDFTPTTKIKGKVNREGIRRMTPREWARLQGFPDKFIIPVADTSAYKQFGNSVAIPAIQATAKEILKLIKSL